MKKVLLILATMILTIGAFGSNRAQQKKKEVITVTPEQVQWFTPSYYKDGRQRAQMYGDSTSDGTWVDRVKIPANSRVLAHTHTNDELVTVIEGTWYVGEGNKFDATKLKGYPAGSFVVIPAGVAHFVASKEHAVIVQINGTGKFATEYVEK